MATMTSRPSGARDTRNALSQTTAPTHIIQVPAQRRVVKHRRLRHHPSHHNPPSGRLALVSAVGLQELLGQLFQLALEARRVGSRQVGLHTTQHREDLVEEVHLVKAGLVWALRRAGGHQEAFPPCNSKASTGPFQR
eukprot:2942542-Pyramimonas_sp.AAC.2